MMVNKPFFYGMFFALIDEYLKSALTKKYVINKHIKFYFNFKLSLSSHFYKKLYTAFLLKDVTDVHLLYKTRDTWFRMISLKYVNICTQLYILYKLDSRYKLAIKLNLL